MEFGVFLPQAGSAATPEVLRDVAQGAEELVQSQRTR